MTDRDEDLPIERLNDIRKGIPASDRPPRERLRQLSQISLLLTYDLIDKIRFWEKQTMDLPDKEIEKRIEHIVRSLERLREAYLTFSEADL